MKEGGRGKLQMSDYTGKENRWWKGILEYPFAIPVWKDLISVVFHFWNGLLGSTLLTIRLLSP